MIDALKKAFRHSWTGGASGDPYRYHPEGAFEDFQFKDLFDKGRWVREQRTDPHTGKPLFSRGGEPLYTNYYIPREQEAEVVQEAYPDPSVLEDATPEIAMPRVPIDGRVLPGRGRDRPFRPTPPANRPRIPRLPGGGRDRPFRLTPPSERTRIPRLPGGGRDRPFRLTPPSERTRIPRLPGAGRDRPFRLTPPGQRPVIPRLPGAGRDRPFRLTPPGQRPVIPRLPGAGRDRPFRITPPGQRPTVPRLPGAGRDRPFRIQRPTVPTQGTPSIMQRIPGWIWDGAKWVSRSPLGLGITAAIHSPDVGAADEVPRDEQGIPIPFTDPRSPFFEGENITPEIQDQIRWGEEITPPYQYVPEPGEKPITDLSPGSKRVTTETPDGKIKTVTTEESDGIIEYGSPEDLEQQRLQQQAQQYMEDNPYYGEESLLPEIPWESIGEGLGEFKDSVIEGNPLLKKILGWWD